MNPTVLFVDKCRQHAGGNKRVHHLSPRRRGKIKVRGASYANQTEKCPPGSAPVRSSGQTRSGNVEILRNRASAAQSGRHSTPPGFSNHRLLSPSPMLVVLAVSNLVACVFFGKSSLAHLFFCPRPPPPGIQCVLNKTIFLSLLVVSTRTSPHILRIAYLMTARLKSRLGSESPRCASKTRRSFISPRVLCYGNRSRLSRLQFICCSQRHPTPTTPPPKILFKQKLTPCPLLMTRSKACALGGSCQVWSHQYPSLGERWPRR